MPTHDCLTAVLTNYMTSDNQCAQQCVIDTIQGGLVVEVYLVCHKNREGTNIIVD